ncbi:histidine kinase [Desulfovibrio sp. X2]|uniref:HDOD domain-containing protein n=1 Tax=Desulfovibrio sp. X2 TaxID=941449 RepID=UPI0003589342|nr:HDOD domain-containing protein [Desulfovibrio sp. X2]EPR37258.1 histidine kinase [Desulfovibrio sp. X2]
MATRNPEQDSEAREQIRVLVDSLGALPSPPPVAAKILSSVSTDSELREIAALIAADPSLALKVMRLANSPAYVRMRKAETLEQAIFVLGVGTLRGLVLGAFIRDTLLRDMKADDPFMLSFWKHSLACAVTAQLLAEKLSPAVRDEAFLAGLVHDCGKIALLHLKPAAYEQLIGSARGRGVAYHVLERERFGADHTLVGKWLLEKWELPGRLVDSAWLHHHSPEALGPDFSPRSPLAFVMLADLVARSIMADATVPGLAERIERLAAALEVPPGILDEVQRSVAERYAARAEVFDLDGDAGSFYYEALTRAQATLSETSLSLAAERDELRRAQRILKAAGVLGPRLASAATREQVAGIVAQCFAEIFPSSEGALFLDAQSGAQNGTQGAGRQAGAWGRGRFAQLAPHGGSLTLPSFCSQELAAALARREEPPTGPAPLPGIDHFAAVLHFAGTIYGRLILRQSGGQAGGRQPLLHKREQWGLARISELVAATLNRIETFDRVRRRSEDFSQTLRTLDQVKERGMQTARLASVARLAAGAAREINNPLSVMSARTQILERQEEDPKKKRGLRQVLEQIDRITGVLQSLMDFARPAPPRLETVDVNRLVAACGEILSKKLTGAGIAFSTDLADDLPTIAADTKQMQTLLVNLLVNAQHGLEEKGGGELLVTTAPEAMGREVLITVRDTGAGIAENALAHVFDPFFTTRHAAKAPGLGLSICHGIVRSHGGAIDVSSREGEWTEVRVLLPVSPPTREDGGRLARMPVVVARFKDVLVADPEPRVRELLVEALEQAGHSVDVADTGPAAVSLLAECRYQLAVVDAAMPAAGEVPLLRAVRAAAPEMPVVALTSLSDPDSIEQAMRLGALKCVRKPFKVQGLLHHLKGLLAEHATS